MSGRTRLEDERSRFKPYPAYRDSGVEWLGEVPEGWGVERLKHLVSKIGSGKTPRGGAASYVTEGAMLLRSQNVHFSGLRLAGVVRIDDATDAEMAGTRVNEADVLLNITGASLGRTCVARLAGERANVNQHVCILRRDPGEDSDFLSYSLASDWLQSQIFTTQDGISRDALTFDQVGQLLVAVPGPPEQHTIATFLDRETAKIDALIERKQEFLRLLDEERAALITQAVTKGLDPDAPMKDSGVEWLGEIPEGWEVQKLRYGVRGVAQGWSPVAIDRQAGSGEWAVIKLSAIRAGSFRPEKHKTIPEGVSGQTDYEIQKGDLLITRANTPELVGDSCLVMDRNPMLMFSDLVYRLRVRSDGPDPRYLVQWLISRAARFQLRSLARGSSRSMVKLSQSHILSLVHPLPPLPEQRAIVAHLDAKTAEIDALKASVTKAIALLQEYRTALISAAVTGKIDVRNEVTA